MVTLKDPEYDRGSNVFVKDGLTVITRIPRGRGHHSRDGVISECSKPCNNKY